MIGKDKDLLDSRARAEFDSILDFGRIIVARRHVEFMPDDNDAPIAQGAWVIFVKDSFFETMRDKMRHISFHSKVYDDLYSFVTKRKFKDMIVVLESESTGNMWNGDLFEDFMVVLIQKNAKGFYFGAASKGLDFIYVNFVRPNAYKTRHGHDCDGMVLAYEEDEKIEEQYQKFSTKRYEDKIELEPGDLWRCPTCGLQIFDEDVSPESWLERYDKEFRKENKNDNN